jgi:hypothetical protein
MKILFSKYSMELLPDGTFEPGLKLGLLFMAHSLMKELPLVRIATKTDQDS